MLEPLLKDKYEDRCKVFLYHTPKLRGVMKAAIPDRFNELIGLQHMKLYIIDNDLIISGLADSYLIIILVSLNTMLNCNNYTCISKFNVKKLLLGRILAMTTSQIGRIDTSSLKIAKSFAIFITN
jgi:hypothetical protein